MGLDCTHGAFNASYSTFNFMRQYVAEACGGSFPPHKDKSFNEGEWYWGDDCSKERDPGLYEFLNHSDCEGDISPEMCKHVADELEVLLPRIKELINQDESLTRFGSKEFYISLVENFIAGCRLAHSRGETLEFL